MKSIEKRNGLFAACDPHQPLASNRLNVHAHGFRTLTRLFASIPLKFPAFDGNQVVFSVMPQIKSSDLTGAAANSGPHAVVIS